MFNSVTQELVFAQPKDDKASIWVSVIEKAFAKVIGNYFKIEGISTRTSIRMLTGNPVFYYSLKY